MDLVDEQDRTRLLLEIAEHALQALLEVAAVLGAGDERAHVERVDRAVGEHVRHLALGDQAGQALGDRGLADPGLADVERVVLAAPAQDLDGALDLELAADQRIDAAFGRQPVEVAAVLVEGTAGRLRVALGVLGRGFRVLFHRLAARLGQSVRDVVDDVEAGHVLLAEQIRGVRLLLAEDRDQHVRYRHFLLAARLDVEHGALQDALEAERRLHLALVVGRQFRRRLLDELLELTAQAHEVGAACAQHFSDLRRVQDREQQMLHGHVLVARLAGALEGFVQTVFEFAG